MDTITSKLSEIVKEAFHKCNYSTEYSQVVVSKTNFCQYQCNGALPSAKKYRLNPLIIAENVVSKLHDIKIIKEATVARPGFININITDGFIAEYASHMLSDNNLGVKTNNSPLKIIIDYGGPNVAKPLHVGHLRSAIIGESIKRIARFLGHKVIADVHLGDWGLQMGMIIVAIERQYPDLPFFTSNFNSKIETTSPITIEELSIIYPKASTLAKNDKSFMEEARKATTELQNGNKGYRALWEHFVKISIDDLKRSYEKLNVSFDLWKGESDSQPLIPTLIANLKEQGFAIESQGALVIDISEPTDKTEIPPMILRKSDGAALYSTTDLATIQERAVEFQPTHIMYVVDKRQDLHFKQVFRCAYKTNIAPKNLTLEHIGFGTMNGMDGRPFKTREGGVMQLSELIMKLISEAEQKMKLVNTSNIETDTERNEVAELVGIAALKFGDLINLPTSDYVFDIERFLSFEGKTGPYLLYSVVRIKSILKKAKENNISWSKILKPKSNIERNLLLKLFEFQEIVNVAFENRTPSVIADYVYNLSNVYNTFYHEHHILNEKDSNVRGSRLGIISLTKKVMEVCLYLLGIDIPEKM